MARVDLSLLVAAGIAVGAARELALRGCLMAYQPSMAVQMWVILLAGSATTVAMLLTRTPIALRWP